MARPPETGRPRPSATPSSAGGASRGAATRRSRRPSPALLLLVGAGLGGWALGNSNADASGAEARGYENGQAAGLAVGKKEGQKQGRTIGFVAGKKAGEKEGTAQGRKVGFTAGKKAGIEEGTQAGYSSGVTAGRSTALNGLSPGSWYIVRVGSDESGAVVSQSQGVPNDASTCFAVSGDTVLSGSC